MSKEKKFQIRNINDGRWHLVAGVYDGSYCYLYWMGCWMRRRRITG
jgi:hypothetical protein